MTMTIPNIAAYPKTLMLADQTQVLLRPVEENDTRKLLEFFRKIPEEERYYLKENVASPDVVQGWTSGLDFGRVIPIVALSGDKIVADATLHRSRAMARRHVGELRIVVDPDYRQVGLGRRLLRELLDIAASLELCTVTFELVDHGEERAIAAAKSLGFQVCATLQDRIRDFRGDHRDLVLLELSLNDWQRSYGF